MMGHGGRHFRPIAARAAASRSQTQIIVRPSDELRPLRVYPMWDRSNRWNARPSLGRSRAGSANRNRERLVPLPDGAECRSAALGASETFGAARARSGEGRSQLARRPRLRQNPLMSQPRKAEELLEKIRALPPGRLAEVEDFVDFLRQKELRSASSLDEHLQAAVEAGHITPSQPGHKRSSVKDVPPVQVAGKPASEMVIEDRR